ncbi:MAG: M14 metallopeptidase family protein, partial [Gemmatimonadota bacterium]|nr:M14 metallopeptidase family protein [Gemmatimonadota bacterium]
MGLFLSIVTMAAASVQQVTTPEQQFGHEIGADYELVNYTELYDYFTKLAGESDRMTVQDIGLTEEGRPQVMAVITSAANHADLGRYREISRSLAKADGVAEVEARRLAQEGKAVVWIDGGLHATEVLGAQQLMELVYRMVSRSDPETLRILDEVILLAVQVNPDGMELVSDWYMREADPQQRSTRGLPVLYQKYAGHDNNRDFYMSALAETTNINRVLYREWFPQIVYNHHQTGPSGTVLYAPPFRDPPNHNLDPLILTGLDGIGAAMHGRFVSEGKGGATMRSGGSYSTWWNGGLRTTPYFKNMLGLLTETIGNPTPIQIPFRPERQISQGDLPLPVEPGEWHFRQSIEYSQTANWAVLDYAARNRDHLLFNIWRMGMNSIERGNRDTWTVLPFEVDAAATDLGGGRSGTVDDYRRLLQAPGNRDPRGFIIPSHQADFSTATKFVNALLKNGVDVHQATMEFAVDDVTYPAGSYVVKGDQAFRPHVMDMFEPQQHPNDFAYPGGPPIPPYDNAGWTLAFQMGVEFDRILDGFEGPFELIEELAEIPSGVVVGAGAAGYVFDHRDNNAFLALNRLLADRHQVAWLLEPPVGVDLPEGAFYIAANQVDRSRLMTLATETGVDFYAVVAPSGETLRLRRPRVALWDRYGGSMTSGWTRKILEDFEFDFEVVYAEEIAGGDLRSRFDVLILEDGAVPAPGGRGGGASAGASGVPAEYRDRIGSITADRGVPEILDFARAGGTVIAVGSSARLGYYAGLPLSDHLAENGRSPSRTEYYTPGSVHSLKIEHDSPLTHGLGDRLDVLFNNSPLFDLEPGAETVGVTRLGWFDTDTPLRSGWAWGQERMQGGTALIEAKLGDGELFLFTPRITFRSQS